MFNTRAALGLAVLGGSFAVSSAFAAAISIDASKRYQTIDGFGSAVTVPADASGFADMFAKDLGASILRVDVTPMVLGSNQPTFGTDLATNISYLNFGVPDAVVRGNFATMVNSRKIDDLKVIGSLWTPPHYMKTSATLLPWGESCGGWLTQTTSNLDQFAKYLAAYVKGFEQKFGVPMYGLSIQNEPRFWQSYMSCTYTPDQYVATLKVVGAEFASQGITTKIMGPEDVGVDGGWITDQQMSFINAVNADPVARQYLSHYINHGYAGDGINVSSNRANWADYYNRVKYDNKPLWQTEQSGENPAWIHTSSAGIPDGALSLALHVHEALAYGNFNAWLYWMMGDINASYQIDARPGTTDKKYMALKHYFKFVRPGSVRIDSTPDVADGVNVDSFVNDANKSLTMVLTNMAATDSDTTITLPAGMIISSFDVYRTSASENFVTLADVLSAGGQLSLTIPAQSVVTLYGIQHTPEPGMTLMILPAIFGLMRRRR